LVTVSIYSFQGVLLKPIKANSFFFPMRFVYKAMLGYLAYFIIYPSFLTSLIQRMRGVKFEKMGSNYIGFQVLIDGNFPELVEIHEGAWLTRGVTILTHFNPTPYLSKLIGGLRTGKVVIGKGAFIGVNSIILPGVNIGEGAVIGAGSVVAKDVPPFTIAAGNPARVIKQVRDITSSGELK
jgi:acetyltransferase-like isoleucine patch superfamily enzyme